ncbi:MAG: anaerobic ribonucleoside-triphosphate reductase activating protein [Candidatus Pacebacteria bacterium]|nr:anaerobic ribonucleoside-triphosphate reductase activating protein [Candidatus Paceibacterota bacterium]
MIEIGGLEKSTLVDYPGRVAATVFLSGCNFRCPFCYSPELVLPEKIKDQPRISKDEFFNFLKERQGLLQGVVICGGEPTLNKDLPEFIDAIKKLGFAVKLDTNGSNPSVLKDLLKRELVDYMAMDIKAPKEKYSELIGREVDIEKIEKSIGILKEGRIGYEFRVTVVPTLHSKEDVLKIAKWLAGAKKIFLQNFRPEKTLDPRFEKIRPYSKEFFLELKKEISPFFEVCELRY